MKVLVTGGAGFIGSHIVDLLIAEGAQVVVVDNLSSGKLENVNPAAAFYHCDVEEPELEAVFVREKPEFVIHLAAQIDVRRSVSNPAFDAEVNILGSLAVLEACRKSGVRKIVYASSAAVYGNPKELPIAEDHPLLPLSPYGVSKYTVEHYLYLYRELYGLSYTALRYANVYGPRQDPKGEGGVVAIFTERLLAGDDCVIYGTGEQTRDFVYVGDVARANHLALENGDGEIFNISCCRETSVLGLYEVMARLTGSDRPPVMAEARPGEIMRSVLDNSRAREKLGWEPQTPVSDGVEKTIDFYRQGKS